MKLSDVIEGKGYIVQDVCVQDEELKGFLLTLGCYKGEEIIVISKRKHNLVIKIKNARYNIDQGLAQLITVGGIDL